MRYASVCDGIGAVHVAWKPLGWECAWTSEIEKFPAAIVDHHFGFPNLGDMTKITQEQLDAHGPINLLVGGTPCQSFSVAGLRGGLDDPRGNLALRFLQLAGATRARWLVWENVPGVLSSNNGRDFGAILGGLAKLGYGFAYRILDAQYFNLAQHRQRVFVVGHLGDWRRAAAVLVERSGLSGHPAPRRQKGQGTTHDVAPCVDASGCGFARTGDNRGQDPVIAVPEVCGTLSDGAHMGGGRTDRTLIQDELSRCLNAGGMGRCDFETETLIPIGGFFDAPTHALRADGFDASEDGTGRGTPLVPVVYPCLRSNHRNNSDPGMESQMLVPVAFTQNQEGDLLTGDVMAPLGTSSNATGRNTPKVMTFQGVRRLTPKECERLQGEPDDFTAVTFKKKPAKDGPRYKAIGNSMAIPVMRWIGERIQKVEQLTA